MPLKAGELRHRVQIQSVTHTTDHQGGSSESWATITNGTIWARIRQKRGRERKTADQVQAGRWFEILIRYHASVTPQMRVLWGARAFRILGISDSEEIHESLVLDCEEAPVE